MLEGLVERLTSCLFQKRQAQDRLEQLQRQTADLPQRFPWPGLGDRRQAAEHVRSLLNRAGALTPALSDLPARGAELFQLTQDPSWIHPSWGALEKYVPPLLKDLTDACGSLEEGIQTERHCAQLVEQHSAALDWLHEQVQGIGALPGDRAGLQSTINTLKALLQTADREEKEMKELDAVKASLLPLCTPSGQTSLQREVGRMQERRARSEAEARARLRECEDRLRGLEQRRGERAQRLREEAADLRGDLHRLGQRTDYSKQPADIGHLQDQWNTLKGCERPLEELGLRLQALQQALGSEVATKALPGDVLSDVAAVAAEHDRLRTRLSERLDSCAHDITHCLRDTLQALQQWNEAVHAQLSSGSSDNTQPVLEEGEKLRRALQGALSRGQSLKDSVGLDEMDRLERDSSNALRDSGVHISNLIQSLQNGKQEAHERVSERPTSLAEQQQHTLGLLDTQVQEHTPQICHMTEEVDIAGFQAGDMPRADQEKVLSQQDISLLSWPADVSDRRKAPLDRAMRTGLQPDTLSKPDEASAPGMQQRTYFTAEKEEPGTQRAVAMIILDTGVQQIQELGTDPLHVGLLTRESTEHTATGRTDATGNEIHRTWAPQQDGTETAGTDQRGSETQDPAMSRSEKMETETSPSKKEVDDRLQPPPLQTPPRRVRGSKLLHAKSETQKRDQRGTDERGSETQDPAMSRSDKMETETSPSKKQVDDRLQPPPRRVRGSKLLHAESETQKRDQREQCESRHTLRVEEVGVCDFPKIPSEINEMQQTDKALDLNAGSSVVLSLDTRTEHPNVPDAYNDSEEQEGMPTLQSTKMATVFLDANTLHIQTPEPVQSESSDSLRIVSSETGGLDTKWTPSRTADAKTQPSDIKEHEEAMSGDTVKYTLGSPSSAAPHKAAQDNAMPAVDSEKPITAELSFVQYMRMMLDTESVKDEEPLPEPHPIQPLPGEEGADKINQEESTLTRLPEPVQGGATEPSQAELSDPTQLGRRDGTREIPTDTAQLDREKSTRVIPTDTAQLEREESVRMVQTDHTQLEEAKPDTPEVHIQVSETAVGRTTESLTREECQPMNKEAVQINQEESTLTRLPEPVQDGVTEPSQIRSADNLLSPDTQETQRRYLVLDLPGVVEVQKVAAKPGALLMEVQDHIDQPRGPKAELSDSTQLDRGDGTRVIPTDTAQLDREKSTRVIPTDTAQLEREESVRMLQTDHTQLEEAKPDTPAQMEREESVRMLQTDHAQLEEAKPDTTALLEREESVRMVQMNHTQLEEAKPDTPEVHIQVSETAVGRTTESLNREEWQLTNKEAVQINQEESALTRLPEPVQGGPTEPSQIISTDNLLSPDTQEIQRRYLVLDLPEVAEVPRVAAEKPGALPVEVQDHVDQTKEPQAEISEPTQKERERGISMIPTDAAQLGREKSTRVIPTDIAQLEREKSMRVIPTDIAQLEREKSMRVIPTDIAQLEREESVIMMQTDHKAATPDTPEVHRPVSETAVGRTTEFAESETVEASLPESATGNDGTLEQATQPEAEREHAETAKTLHPENGEAVGQVLENGGSMSLPLVCTDLAELRLSPSDTPAELSGGIENGNLESIESPQSEENNTMKQLDSSEVIQEVPEEGAAIPGDIREDLPLELPHGPTMQETFKEIQQLVETGPDNFVIGGKPLWKPVGSLDTSRRDLETRLSHVVFRILNSRNRPAQLNTTAMTQQVEEAEDCRQCAQEQLAAFSRLCEGRDSDAAQHAEGQWSAALWDASAAVHAKETQLQLITLYHKQTLAAKATQDKLAAELEELRIVPVESSSQKAEKLRAVQRDVELERTVIGELVQTNAKLSPYLNQADRLVACTQVEHLLGEWRALARAAEKALHEVSVQIQESGDLLQEAHERHDQLEALQRSLGPPQLSTEAWDSQRAGQLMVMASDLTAANQHYHHLQQQTSDALFQRFQGQKERRDVEQALHGVKERVDQLQGQISGQTSSSSNATLDKIMKVMQEVFTWAKQTESDIEAKKKVVLLPEGVHSQIKGLKKLQSEISTKQSQLESFVEEVQELIPNLDEKDTPMVLSSLKTLESLAKSAAEKLARALQDMESGLQTREKMSEQIADVDSWVVVHVHKETTREAISNGNTADLERKLRQLQETLKEADKQAAVTEALLMRSRDIAPELTVIENCRLNDKLISLQEDIKDIISCGKANCQELEKLLQAQESSRKKLSSVETGLRQMLVDLNRFRFPITRDSLCSVEPIKHTILEQKCQVDHLSHCKEDKRKELLCTIAEIQDKINSLGQKAEQHERYLNCMQRIEDLKEKVEAQVLKVKDESVSKEERFKSCQSLLIQLPLIKNLSKVAEVELQNILTDLYPSQLSSEQQRLRQAADSFSTWELTVSNDASILEWALLNSLHYPTEHKAMVEFLRHADRELEQPAPLPLGEQAIDRELLKCATFRRNVESRARVLEAFKPRNASRQEGQEQKTAELADLRKKTLSACEMRMENLSQAREMLGDYSRAVESAVAFLQEAESRLLLPIGCAGSCPEELERTQQALASLDEKFQSHIARIQALLPQHSCLSSYQAEQLHSAVLSQLLVRVSTLQAQAQRRMETLQKCSKKQRMYAKCYKEICQRMKTVQDSLSDCISYNAISYKACLDKQGKLKTLVLEVDSLAGRLEELREWCPEQGCSRGREEAVTALWRDWARLERCARYLKARSDQKGAEWRDITKSVERATVILDQLQEELPERSGETASLEELQEVLARMEQYQDRLDCEHRALTALELRAARLLGVPAHQELSPAIALCQELQTMQGRYKNLKENSMLGRQAVQSEAQERERVKEEIGGVKEWLAAAGSLLSAMEDLPSTQELQEVQAQLCSQKAVLQGIMDGLKMKYSDMYTLVPVEIDGPLQEVNRSLQEVEEKVGEAAEKSGPLCRLGGKVEEIRVGLQVVLASLEKRCPSVSEAESRQKRVWDELDRWHSRISALEVEVHDIADDLPEEAHILTDKLMEMLQLYQHVAKQAEQRTAFLSQIHTCLQEHEEMINSSNSWLMEAHAWLTAPCTYTTAKCLSSHASALQMVLDDSEQMRKTLQAFAAALQEVGSVCDTSAQEEQLAQADRRVASMQQSIARQLSQFQQTAEVRSSSQEVEAIESEVGKMEKNLNTFRDILSSQDSAPSPPEERCGNMRMILNDIESMKRTVDEIQGCKPGLCLPEEAEESLTIFHRAKLLLQQVQSLEQTIYEQNPTLKVAIEQPVEVEEQSTSTSEEVIVPSPALSIIEEDDAEVGQVQIAHVEEDVPERSEASPLTVEVESSPEQTLSLDSEMTTQDPDQICVGEEQAGGSTADASFTELSLGRDEVFEPQPDSSTEDVAGLSLATGASETEATHSEPVDTVTTHETEATHSEPVDTVTTHETEAAHSEPADTVTTQALPQSMELLGQSGLAWRGEDSQPERLKTQSQDTHGTTHGPAGDRPAALALRDVSRALPPRVAAVALEDPNADARRSAQLTPPHTRDSDSLIRDTQRSAPTPCEVAYRQVRDTEGAVEDTPTAPEEDTGLLKTQREQTLPVCSHSMETKPSETGGVHSTHTLNQHANTPADQTRRTLSQSADGCIRPSLSIDSAEPRHTQSRDTLRKPTQSQDTLSLPQDDADSMCPAALLASGETCPAQGALLACREQAAQLELWLEGACRSLGAATPAAAAMQDSFEQQLLNCQEMLLEIEAKVASLSDLGQPEASSETQHQVEALSSKLELLKTSLVTFQHLLQERQNVEQEIQHSEHPPLKRSASVHEMLTSTRGKLIRQNSLQQQRELEHELSEQRDLTKAIARHGSRSRLHSLSQDSPTQTPPGSPAVVPMTRTDGEEGFAPEEMWAHLHTRLAAKLRALEESTSLHSSEVKGAVVAAGSSATTRDLGTRALQELQSHAVRLRELGRQAIASQTQQASSGGDSGLTLEEELYHVLCGVDLSLCSVADLVLAPCGTSQEDDQLQLLQLESLAVELDREGNELGCQETEVWSALGSAAPRASSCLRCLQSRLSVIQKALPSRQTLLRARLDLTDQCQRDIRGLHESLLGKNLLLNQTINEASGHDPGKQLQAVVQIQLEAPLQENQVSALRERVESNSLPTSLIEEVHKLEDVLDSAWSSLRERQEGLRESLDLQRKYEGLLQGLASLTELGRERLGRSLGLVGQSRGELQEHLSSHKGYFQRLGSHLAAVKHFSSRVPDSALRGQAAAMAQLEQDIGALRRQALEHGTQMHRTLQVWTQWEENCSGLGKLLQEVESRLPSVGLVEETEERLRERLAIYQQMKGALEESGARLCLVLEQGRGLQGGGRRDVAAAARELEARWTVARRRVEQDGLRVDRLRRIWCRFRRDSVALSEWMGEAGERLQLWRHRSVTVPQDLEQIRTHLAQFLEFTKEVESRSALKALVVGTATQLLLLKDTETASLRTELTQLEQGWAQVQSALPAVQERLHQVLMERLPSRDAITELNIWISEREVSLVVGLKRLHSHKASAASLTQELQLLKEYKLEITCCQLTVDFVNQSVLQISSPDIQTKRYERTQFAEKLGALNERWHHLQGALSYQTRYVEQLLHICADRENKLQHLRHWITGQRERMQLVGRPVSRSSAEKALKECVATEEKLKLKRAELQVLREACLSQDEGTEQERDCEFITQTDAVSQACAALSQQVVELKLRLQQVLERWGLFERQLNEAVLSTAQAHYTLEQEQTAHLSLTALQNHANQLQLLRDELEQGETKWDSLTGTFSALRDAVSPAAALLLSEQLDGEQTRWRAVIQELTDRLLRAQGLLQRWQGYGRLFGAISCRLKRHEEETKDLLSAPPCQYSTVELVQARMEAINGLQVSIGDLQSSMEEVLEASRNLIGQMEPGAAVFIQSESRLLARSILQLGEALAARMEQLQEELEQLQELSSSLEFLEKHLKDCEDRASGGLDLSHEDVAKTDMLALSALSPDLDALNELSHRVALSDPVSRRLQSLNRRWALASSLALEQRSELQTEVLRQQSFEQKCESWMGFLQGMEDNLAVDIAGSYPGLREQLRIHQRFQVEVSIGHQILHSVINEALKLLERGEVEDRSDFILRLSQLKEQWQGVVRRAQQRRALVDGLARHWQLYARSLRKLRRLLSDAHALLPPAGPTHCSLGQLHSSLEDLKHMELLFHRHQSCYVQTLEVGRQLFFMGDAQTQAQLQAELGALQEDWERSQSMLGKRRTLTCTIIQTWERCEAKLSNRRRKLDEMKSRLKQLLPEHPAELQTAEQLSQEAEDSLEDWAQSLTELATMKTDLSQYIIADDVVLLQEQVEHLRCQWEELCLKVSLRKQEIADRLNAWIIFNEKNKELCEWLTQMENKVAHNADLSIEEMVEKLKKDCMEEINLFSENKTHLKQLGEQLITASNKTKETEINDKLKDINDRWQHLFDHIEARVRKLKETLVTVQQLDKNMSNLRTWLSRIEAELAKPVVYSVCHNDEIQRKLAEQQDLQRDIEQHTEGVASVLTLCDVLLHDADACGSDMENDSIQQTTRSLDRRWRNICAMSMERRMRIEETWRLWCKFLDDYSRFEDWLKTAERTAANPNSADVLYTSAKEELKKFEAFQRQVHERLTQLELVNKQYRRLARENRTDAASKLKVMVHEGNQRWDNLQKRVAAILRRLKHFTSQREEFEGTREAILVWLTEMDLQLTNVEHFSESDIDDKMRQLNGFQQEITLNTNKIDQLIVFGENLIQKCAPLDAVLIEDELEELHSYCQEVFGRVARFHHRLTSRRPMLEEERDLSDRDTDLEDSGELAGGSWQEEKDGSSGDSPSRRAVCHLLAPPLERSGRETPVSVDSIPLEWDHTVDVGGSSSHEDDEEATFYSALSDVEITESPESFVMATTKALKAASGKSVADPPSWHSPDPQDRKRLHRDLLRGLGSSPTHTSTPYQQGYAKLMSECSGSIENVKRVKLILNDDELPEEQGLTSLTTADKQSGVIGRWELLQAQALSEELRVRHNLQQWQQLNSDLSDITAWLGQVLPELDRLRKTEPPTTVRDMEGNIKKLKDMQKIFEKYKAVMISVNLSGRDFQRGDSAEARELESGLRSMNQSWVKACTALDSWESQLQSSLMKCQEFHETLHSLLLWLAHAESRRFAVNIHDPSVELHVLREHSATLRGLEKELLERQREVSSLQAISSQLPLEAEEGEDSAEAKEKVHVIRNKLRLLLRQAGHDLQVLRGRLDSGSLSGPGTEVDYGAPGASGNRHSVSKEVTGERTAGAKSPDRRGAKRDSSPPRSFFYRVLRAAVPLHLLLLLLLVLACLVPLSEEDYSCALSNNFARSFYPMLRYTNGPPPT